MRKYRIWVLALGLTAFSAGLADAGPLSFFSRDKAAGTTAKSSNQRIAEEIAGALRAARLRGFDIEVEFNSGVATLTGKIENTSQKLMATKVVSRVRGVQRVKNQLVPLKSGTRTAAQPSAARRPGVSDPFQSGVRPVSYEESGVQTAGGAGASGQVSNQQMAQRIASALSNSQLKGYDIEIRYADGTATLSGAVAHPQQRAAASQVVSSIPGVNSVENQLSVSAAPVMPAGYRQPPQSQGGPSVQQTAFSHSPKLPRNAWPSYAAYPNYSQVSYPKQYSASAWPYIGPFYPYPQVPMGWRRATLEWDDGNWALKFDDKTDRWFWFLNPKNW